ncbi:hypothetical protein SOVF_053320, partial [Spinacia oleracea]
SSLLWPPTAPTPSYGSTLTASLSILALTSLSTPRCFSYSTTITNNDLCECLHNRSADFWRWGREKP